MKTIRTAVIGYGNVGKYVIEALEAAPDFEIVGIVRRDPTNIPAELAKYNVVGSIKNLKDVDVAILSTPTRSVEKTALEALAAGINTVDSFDIHSLIPSLRNTLDKAAKEAGKAAIISAGWDPGTDSIIRTLLQACAPKGLTYTNFGPGMSMGHSVAVKSKEGVKDALSITIPTGEGVHRRMVYVETEPNTNFDHICAEIKADPYFATDETHIFKVDNVDELKDTGHAVNLVRKGVSGKTNNQLFEFNMKINNPALTAQILVCSARAVCRQSPGCYTMIEVPPVDYLPGEREYWISHLV